MNKTLHEEEIDRQLVELNHGPAYCDCKIAHVGKKTLTLVQDRTKVHRDYQGRDPKITFKRSMQCGDSLGINISWFEEVLERCDLGHTHVKSKLEKHYEAFHLDWSHVEQLIEWIQRGTWSQVNGKEDPSKKMLKEALTIFDLYLDAKTRHSHVMVDSMKKLRKKIKEHLEWPKSPGENN